MKKIETEIRVICKGFMRLPSRAEILYALSMPDDYGGQNRRFYETVYDLLMAGF